MKNPLKALYVDDSTTMAKIYTEQLKEQGIEVVHASDGLIALDKLKTFTPDIILLDIIMPNMNGFEFLAEIKKNEGLKDIPVVLLTSVDQKEVVDDMRTKGAAGYFVKMENFDGELGPKIKEVLGIDKE